MNYVTTIQVTSLCNLKSLLLCLTESEGATLTELCGILSASQYMSNILRDWGDQIVFLEMHHIRSSLPSSTLICTSQSLANDPEFTMVEGTVFDDTVTLYAELQIRCVELLARTLADSFHSVRGSSFWKYTVMSFIDPFRHAAYYYYANILFCAMRLLHLRRGCGIGERSTSASLN